MANIQIADLHSENVVELNAEEQYLIQGGWVSAAATLIRAATPIVVSAIRWGAASYMTYLGYDYMKYMYYNYMYYNEP